MIEAPLGLVDFATALQWLALTIALGYVSY